MAKRFSDAFGKNDELRYFTVETIDDLEKNADKVIADETKIYIDKDLQQYYIFVRFEKLYCGKCWKKHIIPHVKGTEGIFILLTCFDKFKFSIEPKK